MYKLNTFLKHIRIFLKKKDIRMMHDFLELNWKIMVIKKQAIQCLIK